MKDDTCACKPPVSIPLTRFRRKKDFDWKSTQLYGGMPGGRTCIFDERMIAHRNWISMEDTWRYLYQIMACIAGYGEHRQGCMMISFIDDQGSVGHWVLLATGIGYWREMDNGDTSGSLKNTHAERQLYSLLRPLDWSCKAHSHYSQTSWRSWRTADQGSADWQWRYYSVLGDRCLTWTGGKQEPEMNWCVARMRARKFILLDRWRGPASSRVQKWYSLGL